LESKRGLANASGSHRSELLAGFTGGSHFYIKNRITSFLQGVNHRAENLPAKLSAQRELRPTYGKNQIKSSTRLWRMLEVVTLLQMPLKIS
jgi:hypothetical protein